MLEKTIVDGYIIKGKEAIQLDISKQYSYIDKNEYQWRFSFQQIADEEGWFAWLTKPGGIELCVGRITDVEISKRLEANPPLSKDDFIDLELWLIHDGLEAYKPKKKRQRKPKEVTPKDDRG